MTPLELLSLAIGQGLPRYLYKYRSKEQVVQLLTNPVLYFATAQEFNDPYDCNLELINDSTESDWETFLRGTGLQQSGECKFHAKRLAQYPDSATRFIQNAIKRQQAETGIFCLSAKNDTDLMWAHYADGHKGVCVKFDILGDSEAFFFPKRVDYDEHTIRFNYIKDQAPACEALFHKHKQWAYEEEY